jgi:uncharacterized protein YbcC (UPF0753/DUF2309 family)
MTSAAKAKVGALFINGQDAIPLRNTLIELGHLQPPMPMIQTNNSTAAGFANDTIKQKRSKAMDMRFYWIKDLINLVTTSLISTCHIDLYLSVA